MARLGPEVADLCRKDSPLRFSGDRDVDRKSFLSGQRQMFEAVLRNFSAKGPLFMWLLEILTHSKGTYGRSVGIEVQLPRASSQVC